jgi:very-short-patch-repair endonuclease
VYRRQRVPAALRELALHQSGVVTREQALALDFTDRGLAREVGDGTWRRMAPGIYLTSAAPPSWEANAWAGTLIGGDFARIGGRAAAYLHRLVDAPPLPIEVLTPMASRPRVAGPWTFRRERPGARLARTVGAPPRVTVEDTVLDLVSDPDCDARDAVNWVTSAVQARRTTPQRLLRAAQHRHFLARRTLLHEILDDVRDGARSPIEHDYLHKVERAHELPVGRRQVRRRNTEVDVLYDEFGLIVELDGRIGHAGMGRFRDMRRDNSSTTDGLATLRYGKADVFGDPCEVAEQVGINLMRRGWTGPRTRCPGCRRAA